MSEVSWPLLLLGILMVAAGLAVPGADGAAVLALVVLGAGSAVAGVLATQFRQLEIGLQGVKALRGEGESAPAPWLVSEADTLGRIAQLVLADGELARDVVEQVLARIRTYPGRIPSDQRDATTLKTLVAFLEKAEKRRWFNGRSVEPELAAPEAALRSLDFSTRIAFVLSLELPDGEIAAILDRPRGTVTEELEAAREALAPHVSSGRGHG